MKEYSTPVLKQFGTVNSLTAAVGPSDIPDQSDFSQNPQTTGSFDICNNQDPDSVC